MDIFELVIMGVIGVGFLGLIMFAAFHARSGDE